MLHPYNYNPLEPRILKGHTGGGEWTEGGAPVQLAFAGQLARWLAQEAIEAGVWDRIKSALALYSLLSLHNNRDRQAVIEFNAQEFHGKDGHLIPRKKPLILDRDDVEGMCDRLGEVQKYTDAAAKAAGKREEYPTAAEYGTAVHSKLKTAINGPDPKKVRNKDFKAEVSFMKMREEEVEYGLKDSIRVDVYEKAENNTVCVYDIKTGKSGLGAKRMKEIAKNVFAAYPKTRRIVVTEVRPRVTR